MLSEERREKREEKRYISALAEMILFEKQSILRCSAFVVMYYGYAKSQRITGNPYLPEPSLSSFLLLL